MATSYALNDLCRSKEALCDLSKYSRDLNLFLKMFFFSGHIIQNHLQEHTVAALDVLNDLLRDKQPSNTSATSSAQLMCTDCHYQTTSLDNMNTHKTTGSVLCGATILKLTEPDMLSPCSQCNFHPSSLQDKVTHLIKVIHRDTSSVLPPQGGYVLGSICLSVLAITQKVMSGSFCNFLCGGEA